MTQKKNPNQRFTNTIVISFDDVNHPKRKEIITLITDGLKKGWVTYLSVSDDVNRDYDDVE